MKKSKKTQKKQLTKMENKLAELYSGELDGLTPAEIYESAKLFSEITTRGNGITIVSAVKNLYEKYDFTVKEKGIGWTICI